MADQRNTLTSAQIDGLMKTRRANKMENFNLEARLKVLDYKKSQAYIQIDIERDSLRKNIQKIRHVKPDVTGAERRKLLKSGFKRTDASQLPESGDDKLATEGNENWHSRNELLQSNSGNTESSLHKNQEVKEQQLYPRDTRRKSDTQLNRARHHFRVIDPPSRPGSRRNFLQVSDKVLQKEQEKELRNRFEHNHRHDKESGDTNRARVRRSSSYESVGSPKLEALSPIVLSDDAFAVTDIPDAERSVDEIERPQEAKSLQNRLALSPNGAGAGNRSDAHLHAVSWSESESDPNVYDSGKGTSTVDFTSHEQNTSSCSEFHVACPSYKLSQSIGTSEKACENSTEKTVLKEHQTLLLRPKIKCRLSEPAEANSLHKLISDGRAAEPCFQEASHNNHLLIPGTDSQGPSRTSRNAGSLSMHRRSLSKSCPHLNVEVDKACSPRASRAPSPQFPRSRRMEVSSHGGLHNAWTPSAGATKTTKKDEGVYAYDARPNKSLSKGYQKMQVTVGGKQLSVYMPRFLGNTDEPVLARIRNKVTNQQFQPRLLAAKHEGHTKNSKADV